LKGIFDTRAGSGYDDEVVSRYHFPNRYLPAARQCVGDWIIYREPRRNGGRAGYVAVARVARIESDSQLVGHSYAFLADYLPFDRTIPLERGGDYYEGILRSVTNRTRLGAALQGRSIRTVPETEFAAIVRDGLGTTLDPVNAIRLELDDESADPATRALVEAPLEEQERRIAQVLMNRKIRDAAFRARVIDAYEGRCAVTGIRMVNGGGKVEAQAAHIWAVQDGGPDVVQNGLALSATVHWAFDRHLISLADDYGLLVSHNKVPSELGALSNTN
jgi:putative restriction endonuclease